MRNIEKDIGKIAVLGGAGAAVFYLAALGLNQLSNMEHIDGPYHSVERADGAFSSTKYVRYHHGDYRRDEVDQFRIFAPMKAVVDGGSHGENDGLVDQIGFYEGLGTTQRILYRDEDYEAHKEEFHEADKLLAKTKERFKEYFEKEESK